MFLNANARCFQIFSICPYVVDICKRRARNLQGVGALFPRVNGDWGSGMEPQRSKILYFFRQIQLNLGLLNGLCGRQLLLQFQFFYSQAGKS